MIKTGSPSLLILAIGLLSISQAAENEDAFPLRQMTPQDNVPTRLNRPESVDCGTVGSLPRIPSTKSPIELEPRIAAAKQPAGRATTPEKPSATQRANSKNRLGHLLEQLHSTSPNDGTEGAAGNDSKTVISQSLRNDSKTGPIESDISGDPNTSIDGTMDVSKTESSELSLGLQPAVDPFVPSPAVMALQRPLQQCLAIYDHQYLNTREHACWSTIHLLLAHGERSKIHVGGHGAQTTSTVDWLCNNNPCAGRKILYTQGDIIRGRVGPGFQGHQAQLLAILAQIQVPPSKSLVVDGREFTVADLVRSEQLTCREGTELTFKLIGLLHYLPSDTVWTSEDGTQWDFPKLINAELSETINGAACGGTHRIMAISQAALKRRFRGEPIEGEWWRAEKYMLDYQKYAFSLQNADGSFSGEWFKGRSSRPDRDRQLQTTGHILEWLVYSLPDKDLDDPRLVRAVGFLTNLMIANRFHEWKNGPKGHAIRALNLYFDRAFGQRQIASEPRVFARPQVSSDTQTIFSRFQNRFN